VTYKSDHAKLMRETHVNKEFLPDVMLPNDLSISDDLLSVAESSEMIVTAIPTPVHPVGLCPSC
jgi:glycerol-3-phosphate dehydrogenase